MNIGDPVLWVKDLTRGHPVKRYVSKIVLNRITADYNPGHGCAPSRHEGDISEWIPCPADWDDPPEPPRLHDMMTDEYRTDPDLDSDLRAWAAKMEPWSARHRRPLLRRLREFGK